ncbi:DUF397 domain-containing protein [Streptomyces xiamenensis]|uniref:DUF397 domain-containing protein n=1 Tax=Streptomyces xiamenensis TaxID=408015 RepID=UPI0037D07A55
MGDDMGRQKSDLDMAPLDGERVKSSHRAGNGNACVQLMAHPGGVALGDSKRPDLAPLRCTRTELAAFLRAAKTGLFDRP